MKLGALALLALMALMVTSEVKGQQDKVVLCYFESWATYRNGDGEYDVEDIDPFLCNHLTFGFAGVNEDNYEIEILDPYNEACGPSNQCAYGRFTNLKKVNPNLKTLLAVGGWNEGSTVFSDMCATPETRAAFIESSLELIIRYNFDGLDMDWEYPGGRDDSPGDPLHDKDNFSALLREMREAFDQAEADGSTGDLGRLMMTAAVSASWKTIDLSYDIPEISQYLDFINVMTYDFHGWFDGSYPYTGHHSPLYALPEEEDPEHDFYGFSTDFAINYWLDGGAPKDKILLGVPTYGRGFRLADANENGFYALATGPNPAGPYTEEEGYLSFHEYCEILDPYTVVRDEYVISPYGYNNLDWMGYEDWESVVVKAQYVQDLGIAGAFVWAIDNDDYMNKCGAGVNPIIRTLAETLNGPITTPTTPTSGTDEVTTVMVTDGTTGPPPPGGCIPDPNQVCPANPTMLYDNACDCTHYYQCSQESGSDEWTFVEEACAPGTAFNPETHICDFPANVPGCENEGL